MVSVESFIRPFGMSKMTYYLTTKIMPLTQVNALIVEIYQSCLEYLTKEIAQN